MRFGENIYKIRDLLSLTDGQRTQTLKHAQKVASGHLKKQIMVAGEEASVVAQLVKLFSTAVVSHSLLMKDGSNPQAPAPT